MTPVQRTLFELNSGTVGLVSLCAGFLDVDTAVADAHAIDPAAMPDTYRDLLDHTDHMTTTLERYHNGAVALRVLQEWRHDTVYGRMILLEHSPTGRIIEFGIVRMDLTVIPPDARDEILRSETALGDILIRHDVLRRIDPKWFYRFGHDSPFVTDFNTNAPADAFGRVGIIHCNDRPAIQLLEVVTDTRNEA